jgi:hypothetical protein
MRKRAARRTPIHQTTRQDNRPEIGQQMADTANREGGAERFPDPAGPTSLAVDLALMGPYDPLRRDVALTILTTARPHQAHTLALLRTVPGSGERRSLGWRYDMHDSARCPRGQDCVSSGRGVQGRQASAGTRYGTSGATIGKASLTGAFSEAAGRCLRDHPAGQQCRTRVEQKPGTGTAVTVLAHPLARAGSSLFQRHTAFERAKFCNGAQGAERTSPAPHWPPRGAAEAQGAASL